jgi:hypothetical protein
MGRAGIEPATLGLRESWPPHAFCLQMGIFLAGSGIRHITGTAKLREAGGDRRSGRSALQGSSSELAARRGWDRSTNQADKLCGGIERPSPTMVHGKSRQRALSSFCVEHWRRSRRARRPRAHAAPLHISRQAPLSPPAGGPLPHTAPGDRGVLARERRRFCPRAPECPRSSSGRDDGAGRASASPATKGRADRLRPVTNAPGGFARSLPITRPPAPLDHRRSST